MATILGACGSDIICRACGYMGPACVIESSKLSNGQIERCPMCRSLNFVYLGKLYIDGLPEKEDKAVQLEMSL